jgi:hypothetical protein
MEDKSGTYEKGQSSYFSTIVSALPAFERVQSAARSIYPYAELDGKPLALSSKFSFQNA